MRARSLADGLIGDIPAFRRDFWGKRAVVISPDDPIRSRLTRLLDAPKLDEIFSSPSLRPPYVEIKREGRGVRERTYTQPREWQNLGLPDASSFCHVQDEFWRGATLILNHIEDFDPGVRVLRDDFIRAFGYDVMTVSFVTPPATKGLSIHYDTFDGFIVQTVGSKRWTVYEPISPLPIKSSGLRDSSGLEKQLEVELHEGECLYLPWGAPHCAASGSEMSAHITVMLQTPGWYQAAQRLLSTWIPRVAFDERLADFGSHDAYRLRLAEHAMAAYNNAEGTTSDHLRALQLVAREPADESDRGAIELAEVLNGLSDATSLGVSDDVEFRASEAETLIVRGNKRFSTDAAIVSYFHRLSPPKSFKVGEVPPASDGSNTSEILRKLIRAGVLRVVQQ